MTAQWTKLVAHASNPRYLLPVFITVIFLYVLIHLLFATPASQASHSLRIKSVWHKDVAGVSITSDDTKSVEEVLPDGEGVWIADRQIQVMSAIFELHKQDQVMLVAFLKHSVNRDFVCCFYESLKSDTYYESPAVLEHVDLRYIVEYQSSTFSCKLPVNKKVAFGKLHKYSAVSFAPVSCKANVTQPLRIVYPERRTWEFAVCTKVAYSRLEPAHLVEWFEYMLEMGVSKVVTFYNNLHPDSRHVFDHYASIGVLDLIEYFPRNKDVEFNEFNAQQNQFRHDKSLTVRDCQYRLGGYDFVMTIDYDELPVPLRPYGSINWMLQEMLQNHTDASAFRMSPILVPPSWRSEDQNELYHWTFHKGTYIGRYCKKWVYIPARTQVATTHEQYPQDQFKLYDIPSDKLHFLHFRECKKSWLDVKCETLKPSILNETSLARFTGKIRTRLQHIPLKTLVKDSNYISLLKKKKAR